MAERTCPYCGQSMAHPRRVQCGADDCKRAYQRDRMRTYMRGERKRQGVDPQPFDCAQCGTRCTPGENVAPHATKFCGRGCKVEWHREHAPPPSAEAVAAKRRSRRRAAAERRLARAARGTDGGVRVWIAGPCAECSEPFVCQYRDAVACSEMCSRRQKRRRNRRAYRAKYGSDTHRNRARRHGVPYEPIAVEQIFERDGYRCGICGGQTDPNAAVPAPNAPTLDHVIPVSRGGPHLPSNVQCACFECNWRKADGLSPAAAPMVA